MFIYIPGERFLADFQLLQEMRQKLHQGIVTHAALHNIGSLVGSRHDLHPCLVNVAEPLGFLHTKIHNKIQVVAVAFSHIQGFRGWGVGSTAGIAQW